MYRRLLALFTSIILAATALPLLGRNTGEALRAADATTTDLYEATQKGPNGSLSVTLMCNGKTLTDGDTINYGDTLVCSLEWALPDNDLFQLNPGDSLTYTLPGNLNFDEDSDSILNDENKQVGTYTIRGNLITITYTDEQFCANTKRIGNLSFYGSVESDPNPNVDPDEIKISFTGRSDLSLLVKALPTEASITVDKVFHVEDPDEHIYTCLIPITATGNQTNLVVTDTMWPGMDLYGAAPALYSQYTDDENNTPFTDCSAFAHDGGEDHRTFTGTIYHLADGQTVYLFYRVKVVDDMFDAQKGQKWVEEHGWTGEGNYYDDGYPGVIPNRVTLTSDQVKQPVIKTTDIIGSGYNLIKWNAVPEIDQTTGISEDELGYIRWQLVVNPIKEKEDQVITEGYILDTLPENSSLDEGSIIFHDSRWNPLSFDDYLTYDYDKESGTVKFTFNSDLIAKLKTQTEGLYIEYRTHVDKQTETKKEYRNEATLYYNGEKWDNRAARYNMTKPDELSKTVLYDARRAPYAEYTVVVNPMAMDLDPNSSELTFSDTMGSALDLVLESIRIDGEEVPSEKVGFSPSERTFTLKLQDATRYVITYKARINLAPDEDPDALNADNSVNTCELVGVVTNGQDNKAELHSKVYRMSASSSSSIGYGTFTIIKHDEESATQVLSGAVFSITSVEVKEGKVTSTTPIDSKESSSSGKITFDSLSRGTIYRFIEVEAPDGYELDDTPFFVVFAETASSVYPSPIVYGENEYPVLVIAFNRASYDLYVANAEEEITEPTEPTEATEPTELTDPTDSTDPTEPTDPTNSTDSTDPTDPTDPTESTESTEPTDSTEPTESPELADSVEPSESSTPSVGEDPTAPAETSNDIQAQGRGKDQDDAATTPSESSTTTSSSDTSVNSSGRVVKTGEAVSTLAILGGIMTLISFAAVLLLQKKDKEEKN